MPPRVYYYEDEILTAGSKARYKFALRFVKDKLVLDIGCAARMGPFILSGPARKVAGMDISEEAVGYAFKKWPRVNLTYLVADAKYLPFKDEAFDCIVSFELIEHLDNYEAYLGETKRVLRKAGYLIISTPNRSVTAPQGILSNPDHLREFNLEEFRSILGGYFSDITIYGQSPSEKVKAIQEYRQEKYRRAARAPAVFKKIIPPFIKEFLLKKYLSLKAGNAGGITEDDFTISAENLGRAKHFLALCRI
jgi:ubiquinone/menaquinone biosynthesis C-methylase UbiE